MKYIQFSEISKNLNIKTHIRELENVKLKYISGGDFRKYCYYFIKINNPRNFTCEVLRNQLNPIPDRRIFRELSDDIIKELAILLIEKEHHTFSFYKNKRFTYPAFRNALIKKIKKYKKKQKRSLKEMFKRFKKWRREDFILKESVLAWILDMFPAPHITFFINALGNGKKIDDILVRASHDLGVQRKICVLLDTIDFIDPYRRKIVKDALDAHRHKQYNLAIPVLISQIEGLFRHDFGKKQGKSIGERKNQKCLAGLPCWLEIFKDDTSVKNFYQKEFVDLRNDILHGFKTDFNPELSAKMVWFLYYALFEIADSAKVLNKNNYAFILPGKYFKKPVSSRVG